MSKWVEGVLHGMGYPGVALLMFLENVFPPIPSEVVMPLAGFTSTQGRLALWGVIVAGMVGSVAGALPLYFLGRWLGAERLERWAGAHGHWLLLSRKELERARRWFERHAVATVFFGRLVPGVRSLVSIPAGMYRMPLAPFLLWTAAGTGLWAALLALLGHWLGQQYEAVSRYLGPVTYVVLGAIALWYLTYAWTHHRKKHHTKA
jgi:membrane protein DedA with SNARE-associated domain